MASNGKVTLYGMQMATCTKRVLAVLEETGIPYDVEVVDLMKGEHKQPKFLAKQPFGVIPALEDGDLTLFESRAIARYLARKAESPLLGTTPAEQALAEVWLEAESQNYHPHASAIVREKVFKVWRGGQTDEVALAQHIADLNKVLDVYEVQLAKHTYLAGEHFTLADLSHLPYTAYMVHVGGITEPIYSRPHVKAWWDRISSRPAWQKVFAMK